MMGTNAETAPAANLRPAVLPVRLAVFASHPVQYLAPVLRALAAERGIELVVFYGSRHGAEPYRDAGFDRTIHWDVPVLEGYEHVFLRNRAWRESPGRFFGIVVPEIRRHLSDGGHDVILLLGWYTAGHLQAARAAYKAGLPIVLRGDSHLHTRPESHVAATARLMFWLPVRRRLYRGLLRRVDAIVTVGTRNEVFYRFFDVPPTKLWKAMHAVENTRFALREGERSSVRQSIRLRLGVDTDATVFLFVGKLADYKRPKDAVDAFRRAGPPAESVLLFVGDGPARSRLEAFAASHLELARRVRFAGFVNQAELPAWYAAADCVLLPSRETWGFVVNEAMAAGLPVIVNEAAGCAPDLVREGENGWTYPHGRLDELARRLADFRRLSPETRSAMGQASRRRVEEFTPEAVARVLADAVRAVRGNTAP